MSRCGVVVHGMEDSSFHFVDWWYEYSVSWGINCLDAFRWDYGHVFIVVIALVDSWWSRQGVRRYVGFSWDVLNFMVVFLYIKFLELKVRCARVVWWQTCP